MLWNYLLAFYFSILMDFIKQVESVANDKGTDDCLSLPPFSVYLNQIRRILKILSMFRQSKK